MSWKPADYRDECMAQQGDLCAWPPCGLPLSKGKRQVHVDHNHRVLAGRYTTREAVRGAVHAGCNGVLIAFWDKAIDLGLSPIPGEIEAYLRQGEPGHPGALMTTPILKRAS